MWQSIQATTQKLRDLFQSEPAYQPYQLSEFVNSFQTLLPWRHYDARHQLFINERSIGFGLELPIFCGANEELVTRFHDLIKKLPEGTTDIQWCLLCHNQLSPLLQQQRYQLGKQGGIFSAMAEMACQFETLGAISGYAPRHGQATGYLRDLRLFCFVSQPATHYSEAQARKCVDVREEMLSQLAKFSPRCLDAQDFLAVVFPLISPDSQTSEPEPIIYQTDMPLNRQVSGEQYTLHHEKADVTIRWKKQTGQPIEQRVITLNVNQWPQQFCLWQSPDNFCSLLDSSEAIPCPFVITLSFRVVNQEKMKAQATRRYLSISKQAASPLAKFIPSLTDVAADWDRLRKELDDNQIKVVNAYYGVTLYTTSAQQKLDQARTLSVFRKNGWGLALSSYQQLQSFLATLPFMMSEGLYDDLKLLGRLKKLTSFNAANLLPVVGDWKGGLTGMTLTTARNQRFAFDPFQAETDNANMLITGTPGSGKSFLTQRLIFSILAQGGWVFVIDIGGSYKKLCQLFNGIYLEGGDLSLNPFTHVTDIKAHADMIANLLAVMASPRDGLTDVQRSVLTRAIETAFAKTGQATKIDDVVASLKQEIGYLGDKNLREQKDQRIEDIATLLERYCEGGTHGQLFNQPSKLSPDAKFVVLDLDAFKNNKDFMKCVLMSLMMLINERAYQSDRGQAKACFIDEAWAMLLGDNEDVKRFIEEGYRTIRKYGGLFCTISQEIGTFFANRVAQSVYSSTAIKITLRQNLKNFCEAHPDHFSEREVSAVHRFESVKDCGYSSMLLDIGGNKTLARLFADPFSKILFTTEPKQFARVEHYLAQGVSLADAVQAVATQDYADEMIKLRI